MSKKRICLEKKIKRGKEEEKHKTPRPISKQRETKR